MLYVTMKPDVYPTPPRPTSATRDAGSEPFSCRSRRMSQSTKSQSRRKGTVEDGVGLGCDDAVKGGMLLALILDNPICRA